MYMYQPEAIWSNSFAKVNKDFSLTQNVILSQGKSALTSTLSRIDLLRNLTNLNPSENTAIHPEIPSILSDLCYQAGLASTILFNDNQKGKMESEVAYNLRLERIQYMSEICAKIDLSLVILRDRDLRNSLTHIDEHIADILTSSQNAGWFIDVAVKSKKEWVAPEGISINYIRSYIIEDDVIIHLGKELPVSVLREECVNLLQKVFS